MQLSVAGFLVFGIERLAIRFVISPGQTRREHNRARGRPRPKTQQRITVSVR